MAKKLNNSELMERVIKMVPAGLNPVDVIESVEVDDGFNCVGDRLDGISYWVYVKPGYTVRGMDYHCHIAHEDSLKELKAMLATIEVDEEEMVELEKARAEKLAEVAEVEAFDAVEEVKEKRAGTAKKARKAKAIRHASKKSYDLAKLAEALKKAKPVFHEPRGNSKLGQIIRFSSRKTRPNSWAK